MPFQILLRSLEKPQEKSLDGDIEWICKSFGFYEKIDRDKTAASIFKELLKLMGKGEGLTSTQLGECVEVTRGAALNHLKRMVASGFVVREGKKYMLRCSSLYRTVSEIHRDIDRIFEDIEQIAMEIDDRLGIRRRE